MLDVVLHRAEGRVDRIRFWREGEIHDSLGQRQIAFRRAEKIVGFFRGEAQIQRFRRGQADVFDRHAHDAPREIERIFAAGKHAAQPVKRRVGIGVAHALVQRGDQVVVLFAGFVVHQHALLRGFGRDGFGDVFAAVRGRELRRNFQRVVGVADVSAGVAGDQFERIVVGSQVQRAQAAFFVVERAPQQRAQSARL